MSFAVERAQQPPDSFVISFAEDKSVFLRLDGQPPELDQPDFSVGTGGLLGIHGAEIEARPWSPGGNSVAQTARLRPGQLAAVCFEAMGLSQPQISTLVGKGRAYINGNKLSACRALSIDLIPYYNNGHLPPNRVNKELVQGMYEWGMFIPRRLPDMSEEDHHFLMETGPYILRGDKPRDINYAIANARRAQNIDATPSKVEWGLSALRTRLGVGTLGLVTLFLAHKAWELKQRNRENN